MKKLIISVCSLILVVNMSYGQAYNSCAAKSIVTEKQAVEAYDAVSGQTITKYEEVVVKDVDKFGNASGTKYDLAVDGAFEGQTIVVLHFYTGEGFDFEAPKLALKEKGFSVYRYINQAPTPEELEKSLDKACQLWVISTTGQMLNDAHAKVIKKFFDSGRGVYLWGDNDPYHADANFLAKKLVGASMSGGFMANQTVGFKTDTNVSGMRQDHLITTGIQQVYEGVTISQIHDANQALTPLIWSTDGNVVTAVYEQDGKRLIIDGGFTRLFINWDTAGTGRYVKNAAAWLINYEKFGDAVLGLK